MNFLFPLDGFGSVVPSFQLHPVFGIDTERVPPNDAMSRFVGFGDKNGLVLRLGTDRNGCQNGWSSSLAPV